MACGLVDLGIGSKSDLYVIQSRDSKSDINPAGQPPTLDISSCASEDEKLLAIDSGGVSGAFAGGAGDWAGSRASLTALFAGGGGVLGSLSEVLVFGASLSL